MKKGDRVLVPRHGGQYCPGRVMDVYADRVRVTFQVGETYRGKKVTKLMRDAWVFKTVKLDDLLVIEEGLHAKTNKRQRR